MRTYGIQPHTPRHIYTYICIAFFACLCFVLGAPKAHAITISGTLYSDEGTTAITNAHTIALAVGTTSPAAVFTTTVDGSGNYSFTIADVGTGTPLLVFVDASTTVRGTTITKSQNPSTAISNLHIYKDHTIVRHEATSGTTTTNYDLAFYDATFDTDIQYDASTSTFSFTITGDQSFDQELYIPASHTYTPGGYLIASHIENLGTFTASTSGITIGGNFTNSGTFIQNGSTTIFTGMGTYATGTLTGTSTLGNTVFMGGGTDIFAVATDTESGIVYTLIIDSDNRTLYAGSGSSGIIFRCALSTGCDSVSDFTVATDTAASRIRSLAIDETNDVLYAAASNNFVFRCALSTGCDSVSDFTIADVSFQTENHDIIIDQVNGVLYNTTQDGNSADRCVLSTGCDQPSDFISNPTEFFDGTFSSAIDTINNVLYMGSGSDGAIYRCALSTGCNASNEFILATDTADSFIESLTIDTTNAVLYAGGGTYGMIFRCALSTGCDSATDFTVATDTGATIIYALSIDTTNAILYAGTNSRGIIFRCILSTGCDSDNDFAVATDTAATSFYSLINDNSEGVLYAGSSASGLIYRRASDFTFNTYATTSDLTIAAGKKVNLSGPITVGGNFSNAGTFNHNGYQTTFTGMGTYASGTLAFDDVVVQSGGSEVWSVATDTSDTRINVFAMDTTNNVLYAGGSGSIFRCVLSNGCDSVADFTIASTTPDLETLSLTIDTASGTLYVGTSPEGIIYRCSLSTGCDAAGDFTIARDTTEMNIWSFAIDTASGVLYAGSGTGGIIYRCILGTGCDESGDFTTATNTSASYIYELIIDQINGTLYAGSGNGGIIYRCALSTGCDSSGDFTTATDTAALSIWSLTIDTINSVLYAGSGNNGIIYRCALSTGCDAAEDFTTATDTAATDILSIIYDSSSGILHAGSDTNGVIYRCITTTGCDSATDFSIATDTTETSIYALTTDTVNGTLYAGSGESGLIYRRASDLTFVHQATTSDFSIQNKKHFVAPTSTLAVEGNFSNLGVYHHSTGTLVIASSTNQTVYGAMSASSSLNDLILRGGSVKNITNNYLQGTSTLPYTFAIDTASRTIYAGGFGGLIVRCALETDCDSPSDFTFATDTSASSLTYIESMVIDKTNRVLFAGISGNSTAVGGFIYRCALSTGCDEGSDFTIATDTPRSDIYDFIIDEKNGVMYVGADGGFTYRCVLSTGCDSAGDYTIATSTGGYDFYKLAIDTTNDVLYAGTAGSGRIYRCALSTGCSGSGFTIATSTGSAIVSDIVIGRNNGILYAVDGNTLIYCRLSTGCDSSSGYARIANASNISVYHLSIDHVDNMLYASHKSSGMYQCLLITGCDDASKFVFGTTSLYVYESVIDAKDSAFYFATLDTNGQHVHKCYIATGCIETSNIEVDDVENQTNSTWYLPKKLTVSRNYIQSGTTYASSTGQLVFDGEEAQTVAGTLTATSSLPTVIMGGVGTKTFSNNASTSGTTTVMSGATVVFPTALSVGASFVNEGTVSGGANFTITNSFTNNGTYTAGTNITVGTDYTNTNSFTAPSNNLTIGGNFIQSGTFTNNGGTTTLTGLGTIATGTLSGVSALSHLSILGFGNEVYAVATDTSATAVYAITIDSVADVLYAGTGAGGVIFRCALSTGCDSSTDFTVATDTGATTINSLIVDTASSTLYAGSGTQGIIFRCALSTGCDSSTDFTIATRTVTATINTLAIDQGNGTLYASTDTGVIFRCALSTGCDSSGDFTRATRTGAFYLNTSIVDEVNGVLYAAGSNSLDGLIFRCLLSSGCDSDTDFTVVAVISGSYAYSSEIDTKNNTLYIGSNFGYVTACVLSTGCDQQSDFSQSSIPQFTEVRAMEYDPYRDMMYFAGEFTEIYKCSVAGGVCDYENGIIVATTTGATNIYALTIWDDDNSLYAGQNTSGIIYRRAGGVVFGSSTVMDNLSIAEGTSLYAPASTTILGNYTNSGALIAEQNVTFGGTGAQMATGSMTGTSAFQNLTFANGGTKTFLTNASTTNLTINSGATFVAPGTTTLTGSYTNNGTFTHNSGALVFSSSTATTTYTGSFFDANPIGNSDLDGITYADGYLWAAAIEGAKLHKFTLTGESAATSFDINSGGSFVDVTYADGFFWIIDMSTAEVYKYTATGTYTGISFDVSGTNAIATGITYANGFLWILDATSDEVYKYELDGTYTGVSFDTNASGNGSPYAITYGNGYFWITDDTDDRVYQYTASGTYTGISFGTTAANTTPHGITYGNGALWVTNNSTKRVHKYFFGQSISGNATGTSAFNTVVFEGGVAKDFAGNASTTNLIIRDTSGEVRVQDNFSISGAYSNSTTTGFESVGTTTFSGTSIQTATGTMTGNSAFTNLEITNTSGQGSSTQSIIFGAPASTTGTLFMRASTSAAFAAGATSTFENIYLQGSTTGRAYLRSTVSNTPWNMVVPGTQHLVTYVDVRDSQACSGNPDISAVAGTSVDAGGNTCWDFGTSISLSSEDNQTFTYQGSTSTLEILTITDIAGAITAVNDIRIAISTATVAMRFDTNDTEVTLGGTASAKASSTVTFEGGGSVLVIPVGIDFTAGDTLTISGVSVGGFTAINTAQSALSLYIDGASDMGVEDTDDKTIGISGSVTIENHTAGQVPDNFDFVTASNVELFSFKMTPQGEGATTSAITFTLTNLNNILVTDLTNIRLYKDLNNDGLYDGGDMQVGGSGSLSINGRNGTISFSTEFLASTTQDYVLIGDTVDLYAGDILWIYLHPSDVTLTGTTTSLTITPVMTADTARHRKGGVSEGAGFGEVGGAPTESGTTTTGGGNDGGGDLEGDSGEQLGNEAGFTAPGGQSGSWTNGTNALASDGTYMTSATNAQTHTFTTFSQGAPNNNTIQGIEVKFEAKASSAAGTISARLSWDNGSSYTTPLSTNTLTTGDVVYTLGGPANTWGRSWTPAETQNDTFTLELTANTSGETISVDAIQVRVYHQATGGNNRGGGGEVSIPDNRHFANVISAFGSLFKTVSIDTPVLEWFINLLK